MHSSSLSVYAGAKAAATIAAQGWSAEHFGLLLGASGGPKWFILGHLDRFLFGDFLPRSTLPLSALASSVGTWRHACLAMDDPVSAIERMEQAYLYQQFSPRPSTAEISDSSVKVLQAILGKDGAKQIIRNPRITSHIVTARGIGATAASSKALLAAGMGSAALGNTLDRRLLRLAFQRVVFHSGKKPRPELGFADFRTHYSELAENNLVAALHASGSIPFLLNGERNIPGAPRGQYWDGGIIDYHFDLRDYCGERLILYPHFSATVTPGWFDKFLPWRAGTLRGLEHLVLLCPSTEFVAALPGGKIPDRSDFSRMAEDKRIAYWEHCVASSKVLAEDFQALLAQGDPLAGVTVIG